MSSKRNIDILEIEIKAKLDLLKAKLQIYKDFKLPKCLQCFEEINTKTKIAQCISGHMICWSCKEKNNNEDCGMCGKPVNGRAYGWENYLKSVFD